MERASNVYENGPEKLESDRARFTIKSVRGKVTNGHEIPNLSVQTCFRTSFFPFFTGMNFLGGCFLWSQNWAKTTIRGYFGTFRNVLPEKNITNSTFFFVEG